MRGAHEQLRAAGIAPAEDLPGSVRIECTRVARLLVEQAMRRVGLFPAGDEVAIPAVALQLGRALAEQGTHVGVVDAAAGWGLRPAADRGAAEDVGPFAAAWLTEKVALLTPREPMVDSDRLRQALARAEQTCPRLVVDLTGFDHVGEQLGASQALDGVVVVARSGRTTLRQLERWFRQLPPSRHLGVLLTGTQR